MTAMKRLFFSILTLTVVLILAVVMIAGSDGGREKRQIRDILYTADDAFMWAVAMADFGQDDRLELLVLTDGGSSGSAFTYVFDVESGKEITTFSVDNDIDLAIWQDINSGETFYLNQGAYQGGAAYIWNYVNCISGVDQETGEMDARQLFLYYREMEYRPALPPVIGLEEFEVSGAPVSMEEYVAAYEAFFDDIVKVEGSEVKLLRCWKGEDKKEVLPGLVEQAQRLHELNQRNSF